MVELAGREGDQARLALSQLLLRYLPAMRIHLVVHQRVADQKAEDILQEFIARKVLEKHLLARADRSRGRFRSFLLTALDNFAYNELRREATHSKPGGVPVLDVDACLGVASPGQSPHQFDVV